MQTRAASQVQELDSQFEIRRTLIADLKLCSTSRSLQRGRDIHEATIQCGCDSNVYVASALLNMYAKCGSLDAARRVFDKLDTPNVVCWNALIMGYAANGESEAALDLFLRMERESCEPNSRTFLAALKACIKLEEGACRARGSLLHLLVLQFGCDADIYVQSSLVALYAKTGSLENARKVFERLENPTVVAWTALMFGYADNGQGETALHLFARMGREGYEPNGRTFVAALKACADLAVRDSEVLKRASRDRGQMLHLLALENGFTSDDFVRSILIDLYSKCGSMASARAVFNSGENHTVVCCNALILGYADNGEGQTALDVFCKAGLEQGCILDTRSFVAALKACVDLALKECSSKPVKTEARMKGRALHMLALQKGYDSDIYVQNTLVDMYAKCGSIEEARKVFDGVTHSTVVSWTALMLGYAEDGKDAMCLEFFSRMGQRKIAPDARAFVVALKSCAGLASKGEEDEGMRLRTGKEIHILACRTGCASDIYVQGALVDMYATCGCMSSAQRVFDSVKHRNVVSWTALILGYADNGQAELALKLFSRMKHEVCQPDARVYVAALRACTVLGALDLGKAFHAELCSHGFDGDAIVKNCLVDLYAKCGSLADARRVFESHATKDLISWTSLMAGYSRHGDTQGVFDTFDRMLDAGLQPSDVTLRCLLAACSHAGLVDKATDHFKEMSSRFGIAPDLEHYTCLIDLLGRANRLDDAMALLRSMPLSANTVTLMAVLGACEKWRHLRLARLVFEGLMHLDDGNAAAYVVMRNMYDDPCKFNAP